MKVSTLLLFALTLKIGLLIIERSIGMDWNFHIDAVYYIENIQAITHEGWPALVSTTGFDNFFYILCGYFFQTITLEVFEVQTTLILLNITISVLSIWMIANILDSGLSDSAPFASIFVAFSPYFAHLSIHPLKDSVVLFLSIFLLFAFLRGRWILAFFVGCALITARFHLGVMTVISIFTWRILVPFKLSRFWQVLVFTSSIVFIFFIAYDQLNERLEVEFEGRDFYPNGLSLIPESLSVRFFGGWLFNFLVPFPIIPTRISEFGYFIHMILFYYLWFTSALQLIKKNERLSLAQFGLLLCAFFLFSFVLTTTPGSGPLVRYRLFAEILFLIAMNNQVNKFGSS